MKIIFTFFLLFLPIACLFSQSWQETHRKADSLMQNRDFVNAMKLYEQTLPQIALDSTQKSITYRSAKNSIGRCAAYILEKKEAQNLLEDNLQQCLALFPNSAVHATALHNLGTFYLPGLQGNNYNLALKYLTEAQDLRKKLFSELNYDYSLTLNNLAIAYKSGKKFDEAKQCLMKIVQIRKQIFDGRHNEYAKSINELAIFEEEFGSLETAAKHYANVLTLNKDNFGEQSVNYAQTLNNLGIVNSKMGAFDKAEEYLRLCAALREKVLGKTHIKLAQTLVNLALVQHNTGLYKDAELNYQKAEEIFIKTGEDKKLYFAYLLNNIALLHEDANDFKAAEICFNKAKNIFETNLNKSSFEYINFINNLGVFFNTSFQYARAHRYARYASDSIKNIFDERHNDYAYFLYNLGLVNISMNNFEQAHRQISKTVEIYEKNETTKTLKYMWALDALAVCALHKNDKHEYLRIKNRLFDSFKDKIFNIFPTFTEKNKEFFFNNSVKKYVDYHTAISLVNFSEDPSTIYNECILVKGLLLSASQKMKSRILESKDTALVNLYHTWKQQTEQIYQYNQKSKEEKSKEVLAYDSLENAWQETERLLNKKTSSFNVLANKKVYTWRDIQNSLKKSEAAVEIIRINKFGVQKIVTDTSDVEKAPNFPKYPVYGLTDTVFYAALIVKKKSKQPELVLLKNGNDLEKKFFNYQKNTIFIKREDLISYNEFWKPIAQKLKGIKKVYFSPDGVYNQISLNTLQNPETKKYVLDETELHLLTNTKDILAFGKSENKQLKAELLGYPLYDLQTQNASESRRRELEADTTRAFANFQQVSLLPGTKKEVEEIAQILKAKNYKLEVLTDKNATEENIKKVSSPKILHISTHGFFISEKEKNEKINPMLRSGLLLTGVGDYARAEIKPDSEDGVLTALEAANLDLDETDLVVLSACETGLGDVKAGEGVYGLQRAFKVAGAKTIVMSMWKVDDAVTQKLMTVFYKKFSEYNNARKAFQEAQAEIKKQYPEPYFWGAFVMTGE